MTTRLKLNLLPLPFMFLGALILQLLGPSPIWKALTTAFGVVWLVGWVWARSIEKNLSISREVRFGWAQVGDKLEEHFTLINRSVIPVPWLEVIDHSTLPGYSASRAISADSNGNHVWHTAGVCSRRGVYQLGGTTLISGDPLGIYSVEIHHPEHQNIVITPPVIPLPAIEVSPAGWAGEGRPRPNKPEQTINAVTVREYQHGEALKQIHWPTTARRGNLFTRLMEGAPADDWSILLDADEQVQAGDEAESTLELGVILAASLADRGLRAHHSVGLLASGEKTAWLKPQSGEEYRFRLMRELAMIRAGRQPLAEILARSTAMFGRQTSLIIITSSINPDWLTALVHLTWKGITPTVLLIDPASFGSTQKVDPLAAMLTQMGIPRFILSRDLLQQPEARPGWQGQWEWRIMPTGKAVAARPGGDMTWKKLG